MYNYYMFADDTCLSVCRCLPHAVLPEWSCLLTVVIDVVPTQSEEGQRNILSAA